MFASKLRYYLLFMCLIAIYTHASDGGIVAVLEVIVSEKSDDENKVTVQQTRFLTDELRKQASLSLSKTYTILTREKIIALSADVPENTSNEVDIGRAIKSDYVTRSFVSFLGGLQVITVELYNCESGLLLSDFTEAAPDIGGLLKVIRENAPPLFKKINPIESAPEVKAKSTNWLAIGLELVGVGAIGFGLSQFVAGNNYYDKYKNRDYFMSERKTAFENAKNAKTRSQISYIAGSVLLASGITIHILF